MPPRPPAPPGGAPRRPRPAAKPAPKAEGGGERIAKVLARAGLASRRDAEAMIEAGRVSVNGEKLASPARNVLPGDRIMVDGQPLPEADKMRLWLYHKPAGLVTTAKDEQGRRTVFDDLPPELPRVMTIGRLDLNSEGLLLLTNDGALKRRLELPSTGWLRKYRVRVHGTPTDAQIAPLRQGIVIDGERFQPMVVGLDRQQGANAWLTIGLREGKNREVRRAMEAVGLTVNRLIRVSYGPFQLGDLAPGAVEEVRGRVLRDQLGMPADAEPRAAGTSRRPPEKAAAPADDKARPRSWGMKSHGRARRAPAEGAAGSDAPAPGPRSWGRKSHGGGPGPGSRTPRPAGLDGPADGPRPGRPRR